MVFILDVAGGYSVLDTRIASFAQTRRLNCLKHGLFEMETVINEELLAFR